MGGLAIGEFDQLVVTGDLSLDGNLMVELLPGYTPTLNSFFEIIDVGGIRSGQFIGLGEGNLVGNFGGLDFFITYTSGDGNNVSLFTIPEPSTLPLVSLAILSLAAFGRRRRNA